jgi:hypothetical protein
MKIRISRHKVIGTIFLLLFFLIEDESVAMQYLVEMLPAKIAGAIPVFVAELSDGESTFISKDLIVGKDSASNYRFGIAERRKEKSEPLQRRYLFSVDNDGKLAAIGVSTSSMANEQIIEGGVLRALLVAMTAYQNSTSKILIASVGWRSTDQIVTVMFIPARSDSEGAVIGGVTSGGRETHYHVDRDNLQVIRMTLAR